MKRGKLKKILREKLTISRSAGIHMHIKSQSQDNKEDDRIVLVRKGWKLIRLISSYRRFQKSLFASIIYTTSYTFLQFAETKTSPSSVSYREISTLNNSIFTYVEKSKKKKKKTVTKFPIFHIKMGTKKKKKNV